MQLRLSCHSPTENPQIPEAYLYFGVNGEVLPPSLCL